MLEHYADMAVHGLKYDNYFMSVNGYEGPDTWLRLYILPALPFNSLADYDTYMKILRVLPNQVRLLWCRVL